MMVPPPGHPVELVVPLDRLCHDRNPTLDSSRDQDMSGAARPRDHVSTLGGTSSAARCGSSTAKLRHVVVPVQGEHHQEDGEDGEEPPHQQRSAME